MILRFEDFINEQMGVNIKTHMKNVNGIKALDEVCKYLGEHMFNVMESKSWTPIKKDPSEICIWEKSDLDKNAYTITFNIFDTSDVIFDLILEQSIQNYDFNVLLNEFIEKLNLFLSTEYDDIGDGRNLSVYRDDDGGLFQTTVIKLAIKNIKKEK